MKKTILSSIITMSILFTLISPIKDTHAQEDTIDPGEGRWTFGQKFRAPDGELYVACIGIGLLACYVVE